MASPRVLVLCYHGLSERWPEPTAVMPDRFEEQLALLQRHGYRAVTFSEAVSAPATERIVAVTFDDAPRSVATLAAPVMARLGVPGTVFVPTAFPDSGRPMAWPGQAGWVGTEYEHELACMSWDQLGELAERGWEIGSHTRSHPRLTQLEDERLEEELRGSREDCRERLGGSCATLAYPYGDWDERVAEAADDAGYRAAATTPREPARPLPLLWPRVGVYRQDSARRLAARIWRRGSVDGSPVAKGVDSALRAARRALPR